MPATGHAGARKHRTTSDAKRARVPLQSLSLPSTHSSCRQPLHVRLKRCAKNGKEAACESSAPRMYRVTSKNRLQNTGLRAGGGKENELEPKGASSERVGPLPRSIFAWCGLRTLEVVAPDCVLGSRGGTSSLGRMVAEEPRRVSLLQGKLGRNRGVR